MKHEKEKSIGLISLIVLLAVATLAIAVDYDPPYDPTIYYMHEDLKEMIDLNAGDEDYYNEQWNVSLSEYKAWIALISVMEAGNLRYTAHSSGNLSENGDIFYHITVDQNFPFSTGIGVFQLDRGGGGGGENWSVMPTIDKMNPEKSLLSTLRWHKNKFGNGATLANFSAESVWYAVKEGYRDEEEFQRHWQLTTDKTWDECKNVKLDVAFHPPITNASPSYDDTVEYIGKAYWNLSGWQDYFQTWLISAKMYRNNYSYSYYYAKNDATGWEMWVWNAEGLIYRHARNYSTTQFPANRTGYYAGFTDTTPALDPTNLRPGSGTEEDPYIITNVYQLQEMNNDLDAWYELGNNIDASETETWNEDPCNPGVYFGFIPIGGQKTAGQFEIFEGHFDGKGYIVTDLYMNNVTEGGSKGLFGVTDAGSKIKNAALINVVITCPSGLYTEGMVGGLIGINLGSVTDSYSTGRVNQSGNSDVGGLVGVNYGSITNSYSTAKINGGDFAGGLVGSNLGEILNSHATGNVSGWSAGGLVGANNTNDGTIINCYSSGQVVGDYYAGGLVGESNGGNCESCFWDIETSGQETSAGGTGKTAAKMKQEATFTNWDFVNIWDIDEGVVRPFLICFDEILIAALSPVDLIVTDPDGLEISKQLNEIPGATYLEYDLNGDGELDDIVTVPKKLGDYSIQVVPEPNALPTDTYSLETTIYGQTIVLAEDVQIEDIPEDPYELESKLCYSDFDDSNDVDFVDYAIFMSHWSEQDCNYPGWCEGTDLDYSGSVGFNDLTVFTESWLWPDS